MYQTLSLVELATLEKNKRLFIYIIEIKPKSQTIIENAKGRGDKVATTINAAKWTAANEWAKAKGMHFKVITEDQIFRNNKKRKPTQRKPRRK